MKFRVHMIERSGELFINHREMEDRQREWDKHRSQLYRRIAELEEKMESSKDEGPKSDFALARRTMAKHLRDDGGLYISYQANVAMFLHDHCGVIDYEARNKLATDLLHLLFETEVSRLSFTEWMRYRKPEHYEEALRAATESGVDVESMLLLLNDTAEAWVREKRKALDGES